MFRLNRHSQYISAVFFLLLAIVTGCGKAAPKDGKLHFDDPHQYNIYITEPFNNVMRLWGQTLEHMDDSASVYIYLDSLGKASELGTQKMQDLGDYKGDTTYRESAARFFAYMNGVVEHELKESIEIALMPDISDSLHLRFIELGNQIGYKKELYIKDLQMAQRKFALKVQKE